MSAPIFVTGTGTDIGKTHILAALLAEAGARVLSPLALKPVLSGFDPDRPGESDSARLLTALGRPANLAAIGRITPWRFRAALSPDIAAAREGVTPSLSEIADFCAVALRAAEGPAFVEGAGGVMSPIAADGLNIDLILALEARPLLVCGAYLGAISHTLTALASMRAAGAPPALVLVNPHSASPGAASAVAGALERFGARAPVVVWDDDESALILRRLGVT